MALSHRMMMIAPACTLLLAAATAFADEIVYDDQLAPAWQSWSWSGSFDFAATDQVYQGAHSIHARLDPWGAVSLYSSAGFGDAPGISFWIEGDDPQLQILLEADAEGYVSSGFLLSDLATVTWGSWTRVAVSLTDLGSHDWTRIDFKESDGAGAEFHLDEIYLLDEDPNANRFKSAEPVALDRVMLLGGGDPEVVTIRCNGVQLAVTDITAATDPDRSYLDLDATLSSGTLEVMTADGTFTRTLTSLDATLASTPSHDISPLIYGVAFPEDEQYVEAHGVAVARWGGNATSLYNPFEQVSNTGSDWYFENYAAVSAEDWLSWVQQSGAQTLLTVPALDYVAKDDTSYSYSQARYGAQSGSDPWKPDAGDGVLADGAGTEITWNNPRDAGTAWTTDDLRDWLGAMATPPDMVAVDNELDITCYTHRDVHPDPMSYDELLERFLAVSRAVGEVLPDTPVTGPVSCCWWYYWNSVVGSSDKATHDEMDLLPWFLREVAAADAASGARSLDYLDLHYYPADLFGNDAVDDETRAWRLRATRSLWDPDYTDESWIGWDIYATQDQPHPNEVWLIPRFKDLIATWYPGTRLAITEWNWGAESDISGGLAVADVLGIFAREELDLGIYWTSPPQESPAAAAFQLYRQSDLPFGDRYLPLEAPEPDLLGAFAALDDQDRTTVVVINKDPNADLLLAVADLPSGVATTRHFGGELGGTLVDDPQQQVAGTLVVPAYGAVFLAIEGSASGGDTGGQDTAAQDTACGDTACGDNDLSHGDGPQDAGDTGDGEPKAGCGCRTGGPPSFAHLLMLCGLLLLAVRRSSARVVSGGG